MSTINAIDQFETGNGAKQFPRVGDANPVLLRKRLAAHSAINPAASADHPILFVGDFSQYVVLDRVGLFISFLQPGVLQNSANGLPDGRVGWYGFWRVGADVLIDSAFRVMNIATTA